MSKKRPEPELTTWPVDKLRKHPKQDEHFGDRSYQALKALADLIERNGMDPIDITPAGVILSGHQRRYIAQFILRWTEVPVRIRHDLAWDGPAAEEAYFIDANAANRRLSWFQQVRNYAHGLKLDAQRQADRKSKGLPAEPGRARDRVAALYGLKGRTLDDWLPLLKLPREVQQAIEDGRLSRPKGMSILAAPANVQAKIAKGLGEHKTVSNLLRTLLPEPKRVPPSKSKLTRRWRELGNTLEVLLRYQPKCFDAMLPQQRHVIEWMTSLVEMAQEHLPAPSTEEDQADQLSDLILEQLGPAPLEPDLLEPTPQQDPTPVKPAKLELVLRTSPELVKSEKPTLVLRASASAPKGKKPKPILVRKDAVA